MSESQLPDRKRSTIERKLPSALDDDQFEFEPSGSPNGENLTIRLNDDYDGVDQDVTLSMAITAVTSTGGVQMGHLRTPQHTEELAENEFRIFITE